MRSLATLLLAVAVIAPETIPAPPTIARERGSIVVSGMGSPQRWTADWTMEPSQDNGRPAVRFTETGGGQYSPFAMQVRWKLEALWAAEGHFQPLRSDKTITDMSGRPMVTERKRFDPSQQTVQFERVSPGHAPEQKQFSAPSDTLVVEGIAGILRFLPFEHWSPISFHLLSNEPRLYAMKIQMRGKERVKAPAGEFDCYKLELVPELGALNLVRPFLRKAYFWFSAAPPHFWVRYEGPENGQGTLQIVMELKTYEPGR